MNTHKDARLTPQGRALMIDRIVDHGWSVMDGAQAAGLSTRRACIWLAHPKAPQPARRNRRRDRSAAPPASWRTGHRRRLGLPRSTVSAVLRRIGLGRLDALAVRPPVVRYERQRPGELIHVDTKKLGRISGVGHRIPGERTARSRNRGVGWECLHVAIDDASRLAYTEVLANETKETACAFMTRALDWFAATASSPNA